ncbi:MAG: hypothetical protein ACI4M0_05255 [Christensenellales bacterium]
MKKKNRNACSRVHDYTKYASKWNGVEMPCEDERYYGIHRDGNRIKIDIKRMKKLGTSGVPASVLDAASAIPRNTTYFLPKRLHRQDYVINQFRDKIQELSEAWKEYKLAFLKIVSPADVAEQVRTERLNLGIDENEDATAAGIIAGAKRQSTYNRLWISQCAQFIQQMATELDALMLRKCVYLGFAEKEVTRGKMHTYLNGTMKGRTKIEALKGYDVYAKFFTVWNMLKHNSEDLFEKIQKNYPDMLLTTQYRNGEMSQYYLKIGDNYIEKMLSDLLPFYEDLCSRFFEENVEEANWNYDDYFLEKVRQTMREISNPLDV